MKFITYSCIFIVFVQLGFYLGQIRDQYDLSMTKIFSHMNDMFTGHAVPGKPQNQMDWLCEQFQREGIHYRQIAGKRVVQIRTLSYKNRMQENAVDIVFMQSPENPENITVTLPFIYTFKQDGLDPRLPLLPIIQYQLSILQIDYDPRDGEVRGMLRMEGLDTSGRYSFGSLFRKIGADLDVVEQVLSSLPENPNRDTI